MAIASWNEPQEEDEAIRHEAIQLTESAVNSLGGMGRFISRGDVVFIKPNIGWNRMPAQAANTNPDVVGTLVKLCFEAGAGKVRVSDLPCNDQRRTFVRSGIRKAAEDEGADVFFMDPRKFREVNIGGENLRSWPVYTEYIECDRRINVPIAKHHSLARLTLAGKNLMGVIQNRGQIHANLGQRIADLASIVRPRLTVVDAVRTLMAHGPTGGNLDDVRLTNTVIASHDIVAADAYAATLFGLTGADISYVKAAAEMGLGTLDLNSIEIEEIQM